MPARSAQGTPSVYLVDAYGFVFRAYHALPPLSSPAGVPTGAVFGFCQMLFKLLEEHDPDYLAAVFDTPGPTFRHRLFDKYKANRPPPPADLVPQLGLVDRVVRAFSIPSLSLEGYEADDLIATLTTRARAQGMEVTIVSSDKDLMQLTGPGVRLLDTMKGKVMGPAEVQEKFGVPPQRLGDYLALCGDSVDNVPGLPGVGAKTAARLLAELGDLGTVLASAGKVKGARLRENLVRYADQVRLSRRLVQLCDESPLDIELADLLRAEPDHEALFELFVELGFSRLLGKVSQGARAVDRSGYRTILDEEALAGCIDSLRRAGRFAVDLETTSLDAVRARIVGLSLAWGVGEACYIPVGHAYLGHPPQLPLERVLQLLGPLLTDESLPKVAQNHKYDWIVLRRAGLQMRGIAFDPMLASYVLDPSRNTHGLDSLALDHLGHRMISFKEVAGTKDGFAMVEVDTATEYAAEDADVTLRLAGMLGRSLQQDPELNRLFDEVEMPLSRVLAEMELRGVLLHAERLHAMIDGIQEKLCTLQAEVQRQAGWEVNLNSPKQLQQLLFEELGLAAGRKIKTGYSTDSDVLQDLALLHPIAGQIEEHRTLSKLRSTYIDTLPTLVNPETGRVHTSYNQAVTATGRLSSSDPNLQNIPVRTELGRQIREAFVAPPGRVLLSADYSQVELRVLAHLSEDAVLLQAFSEGQDVHLLTAVEIFGVGPREVTPEQRRVAKAVNFGVIYGQTDFGLSRQLRIPRHTARSYIEAYFRRHAGVKRFMERAIERARETREVRTLLGRKRPVPEITSAKRNARLYAERVVRNTPIQGTAADLMKLAMLRVHAALQREKLDAPMILTVHDELVFEVRPGEVQALSDLVREVMAGSLELSVPLVVDTGAGESWAQAHA